MAESNVSRRRNFLVWWVAPFLTGTAVGLMVWWLT